MSQAFTEQDFHSYSHFITERFGIRLNVEKAGLLKLRLNKLMQAQGVDSYTTYLNLLKQGDPNVVMPFVEEITVNKTGFFREEHHFSYLTENLPSILRHNQAIVRRREFRAWSSACSTGEEPYTLAMVLSRALPADIALRILATDINNKVLTTAQGGVYPKEAKDDIPPQYQDCLRQARGRVEVAPEIRSYVTFRHFNLVRPFPFQGRFDLILCRNVMIYFDERTQQELITKFYQALEPGGLLFIGHSETLSNREHRFQYIQPTIYMK